MRILAIRGANLASLTRFSVDLSSGPLAGTNIFAIVGPTGAGKSTLLDALCLALYGRTPRLSGKSGVQIGFHDATRDLRVGAVDPRSILRRGAGEAHAEVDFAGIEGGRWRASWSVHRARKRPDGAVQQPRVTLTSLDDERDLTLATNTETLDVIERKIGLSFVQFCRSVLLAQGEFAAFLRASPDERAQLLEQMTGTEVYGALSRQAHLKARLARERLDEIERDLERVSILSDTERADLAASHASLDERRAVLETSLSQARLELAWHEELERLEGEVGRAQRELDSAINSWEALATRREEMALVERAAPFREAFAELEATKHEAEQARRHEEDAEARLDLAERVLEDATNRVESAECALAEARATLDQTAPALERARVLDAQIADAREATAEADHLLDAATAAVRGREALVAEKRALESQVRTEEEEAKSWLDAHSGVAAFAEQWPRWDAELSEYAAAHADRVRLATALRAAELTLEKEAVRLGSARAELDAAYNEKADATVAIAAAREAFEAARARLPTGESQRVANAIAGNIVVIDALTAILEAARTASQQRTLALEEANRDLAIAERCRTRETESAERCDEILRRLLEAQREWSRLLTQQEMAARRGELLTRGDPCPLCGSTFHPWAHNTEPSGDVSNGLEKTVQDLQRSYDEVRSVVAGARAEAATRTEGAERTRARAAELGDELSRHAAAWTERRLQLEVDAVLVPESVGDPSARDALFSLRADLVKRREATDELENRAQALQGELDAIRAVYDEKAALIERLALGFEAVREEVGVTQRAKDSISSELEGVRGRCHRSRVSLEGVMAAFDGWVMEFEESPEAFRAARRADAAEWRGREESLESTRAKLASVVTAVDGAMSELTREKARQSACAETARKRSEREAQLRSERSAVLDGRSRDAVEVELREGIASCEAVIAEAKAVEDRATREAGESLERAARAREALTTSRHRLWAVDSKVEAAVTALGVGDVSSLRALVEKSGGWLENERVTMGRAREAIVRLEGLVEDRRARHAEHAKERPGEGARDEVRARIASLETDQREASEQLGALADRVARDDENRQQVADLSPLVESQRRAADTWSRLDEVIGSADGKKFRRFAQSLTLDALLAQANCHLSELRPRYKVERVPRFEMEMQVVDTDMGDEVRTIASLSGGETFLVSLALALGLSSLAAGQVRIESLFIDEGFGTLDKDTLEVALSVLDQLQAKGRSIGIISHVPDLAERVGFQVSVVPVGPGRSVVRVSGSNKEAERVESPEDAVKAPRRRAKRARSEAEAAGVTSSDSAES